ncbi:ATP-binding protein [Microbacterium sp. NPDC091382]|uniref:sensor histidine kinase n=1 Tax=Microbacterium sp. NPDC091382 TaxID=3364210 RepID=UPI0037FADBA8
MTTATAAGKAPSEPWSRGHRWGYWFAALACIVVTSLAGLTLQSPGLPIAWWWPAAGAAAWFVLRVPRADRAWLILTIPLATITTNILVGRPWYLGLLYGLCNTLEIVVFVAALGRQRDAFRLDSLVNAVRFVGAALLGAVVLGVTIAAAGALLAGGSFFSVAIVAFASHSSAVMLIGALAALPPPETKGAHPIEVAVYLLVAAATLFLTFGPGGATHVTFLVFAVLAAACLRFPIRVALALTLLTCVAALLLTLTAGGSFGFDLAASRTSPVVLVVFMSTVGVFSILVSAARYEGRRDAAVALSAAEEVARAERARVAALAAQLELQRQREDFAVATSHELRTPLTNMLGYTDLLLDSRLDDQQRSWLGAARRGAERLRGLIDTMIDARESQTCDAVAVDSLLTRVQTAYAAEAASRRSSIVTKPSGLVVRASDGDAERALSNLVSNAITFAENGTVTLEATRVTDDVLISVTDDGPGMSATTLQHAFDRFYRGPEAEGRGSSGVGLGLGSARDLARRNGGDVTVTSVAGHGVSAVLRLPALTDADA